MKVRERLQRLSRPLSIARLSSSFQLSRGLQPASSTGHQSFISGPRALLKGISRATAISAATSTQQSSRRRHARGWSLRPGHDGPARCGGGEDNNGPKGAGSPSLPPDWGTAGLPSGFRLDHSPGSLLQATLGLVPRYGQSYFEDLSGPKPRGRGALDCLLPFLR